MPAHLKEIDLVAPERTAETAARVGEHVASPTGTRKRKAPRAHRGSKNSTAPTSSTPNLQQHPDPEPPTSALADLDLSPVSQRFLTAVVEPLVAFVNHPAHGGEAKSVTGTREPFNRYTLGHLRIALVTAFDHFEREHGGVPTWEALLAHVVDPALRATGAVKTLDAYLAHTGDSPALVARLKRSYAAFVDGLPDD